MKTPPDVALGYAGRTVADGAMRREMLDADEDLRGVVESRRGLDTRRIRLDRAYPRRLQDPACHRPVRVGCGHIVKAGIYEGEGAEKDDKSGDEDGGDDSAQSRPLKARAGRQRRSACRPCFRPRAGRSSRSA